MEKWKDKKVIILGLGRSGIAAAKTLKRLGAQVFMTEKLENAALLEKKAALLAEGITVELGGHTFAWLDGTDLLVVSPGVPLTIPYLVEAQKRQIRITSELEIAWRLTDASFVAITGTNGKTTTTTLVGEIAQSLGCRVLVGGNIGISLVDKVQALMKEDVVVAEVSSFQLETTIQFRPKVSAILNITEDHLDRHKTMENYRAIKSKIFLTQHPEDTVVLNADDELVVSLAKQAKGHVLFFSQKKRVEGVYAEDGEIFFAVGEKRQRICCRADIQIKGPHNLENALCAIAVSLALGMKPEQIVPILQCFQGVEHRLEFAGEKQGIRFYNDSKATNPDAVIKALQSFAEPIVLIAGGRHKGVSYADMAMLIQEKVKAVILLGEATNLIEEAVLAAGMTNIYKAETMLDAVEQGYQLAETGEVVLLSPACSSFDMFVNYEVRGEVFKEAVKQLT